MEKVRVICNSETLDVVNLLNNGKPSAKTGTVLGCICLKQGELRAYIISDFDSLKKLNLKNEQELPGKLYSQESFKPTWKNQEPIKDPITGLNREFNGELVYRRNLYDPTGMKGDILIFDAKHISYQVLIRESTEDYISYYELLETIELKNKRAEILHRDSYKCNRCQKGATDWLYTKNGRVNFWWAEIINPEKKKSSKIANNTEFPFWHTSDPSNFTMVPADKPYHLQVHHKYYELVKLPWAYPNDALETLCNWCHEKLHETETVPVFYGEDKKEMNLGNCERCGGKGYLEEYRHVQGGICFKCNGTRFNLPPIRIVR